jgi:hypothetical protein
MAKKFEIPKRMSEGWLKANVPGLRETQARALIEALKAKGWTYRQGSLEDRVFGRLQPGVREAMEAERKAAEDRTRA